jgi:cytidylate kinase
MQIAINGDLGSGKSKLARALTEISGAYLASTGAIQRSLAEERGMSVLELNQLAETDPAFDKLLRDETIRLAGQHNEIVFDSRLAFFFLPEALSIHLLAHPSVAGKRLLGVDRGAVESYGSADEAAAGLIDRRTLERERYLRKYGVDIGRIENYDVVVQTDLVTERECHDFVLGHLTQLATLDQTSLYLNPLSVVPLVDAVETAPLPKGRVSVLRYGDISFALAGLERLRSAIRDGEKFLRVDLAGQDGQHIQGAPIEDIVASRWSLDAIEKWEVSIGAKIPKYYYAGLADRI